MKRAMIVVAIILGTGLTAFFINSAFTYNRAKASLEASGCRPTRGQIMLSFKVNGSVEPRNELEITPQISGRIEQILVKEGDAVKKGQIIAWMSSTDRATILDLASTSGQEDKQYWETVYKATPIIAPLNGFIISRKKEPGQSVTSADAILVMADKLIIEANVDETDLKYIKVNQTVNITLDAYPDESYQGMVESIAYQSEVINNVTVYKIKIQPTVTPKIFRAGMTATVDVVIDKRDDALMLPVDAVQGPEDRKFVKVRTGKIGYQIKWSGIVPRANFRIKPVETGIDDGKNIEIISGLGEDDVVIMSSTISSSASETNDRNMMPMMPPPGGGPGGR